MLSATVRFIMFNILRTHAINSLVRKLQVAILKLTQIIYESARNYEKLHFNSDILIWISKIQISQEGFVLLSLLHDPYLHQFKDIP